MLFWINCITKKCLKSDSWNWVSNPDIYEVHIVEDINVWWCKTMLIPNFTLQPWSSLNSEMKLKPIILKHQFSKVSKPATPNIKPHVTKDWLNRHLSRTTPVIILFPWTCWYHMAINNSVRQQRKEGNWSSYFHGNGDPRR